MNGEALAWVAVATFLGATIWTAARARTRSDAFLPLGLACVTVASALRIPAVVTSVQQLTGAPVDAVARHTALVVGCVLVSSWVMQTLTGRRPKTSIVVGACLGAGILLIAAFSASAPWLATDMDTQTEGKPLMGVYWAVYYGTFLCATAWFAYSAARSRSRRIWQLRWGTDLAAVGAVLAMAWAIVSILTLLQQTRDPDGSLLVLGVQTRYLIAASSVLATVGLVGQLTSAAIHARYQRSGLAHLHRYVTAAVSATVPPQTDDRTIDSYHRTIQILDAIGTLAHYSTASDRASLAARMPAPTPETLVAHELRMSAARLANGEPRSASPANWTEHLTDESSLPRLGRALMTLFDQADDDTHGSYATS